MNYKKVSRYLKKNNLNNPVYVQSITNDQLIFKILARGILFARKNSITHTNFYAYIRTLDFDEF